MNFDPTERTAPMANFQLGTITYNIAKDWDLEKGKGDIPNFRSKHGNSGNFTA